MRRAPGRRHNQEPSPFFRRAPLAFLRRWKTTAVGKVTFGCGSWAYSKAVDRRFARRVCPIRPTQQTPNVATFLPIHRTKVNQHGRASLEGSLVSIKALGVSIQAEHTLASRARGIAAPASHALLASSKRPTANDCGLEKARALRAYKQRALGAPVDPGSGALRAEKARPAHNSVHASGLARKQLSKGYALRARADPLAVYRRPLLPIFVSLV